MMQLSTLSRTPRRHHTDAYSRQMSMTGETLLSDMLKNVDEVCETLEATKSALEKATLAVTKIRNKIHVAIFLLICYK